MFSPQVIFSQESDFQIIHSDVYRGYGIACKFTQCSDSSFEITESIIVLPTPLGPVHIPYYGLGISKEITDNDEYGYQIEAEFKLQRGRLQGITETNSSVGHKCKMKKIGDTFERSTHLIDVKISDELKHFISILNFQKNGINIFNDLKAEDLSDYGQHYCKFYITEG